MLETCTAVVWELHGQPWIRDLLQHNLNPLYRLLAQICRVIPVNREAMQCK
jgi:hypothetical protein